MQPKTVYDIGVGFGSFGSFVREATDLNRGLWHRDDWEVWLEGCEIYEPYVEEFKHQNYLYNNIEVGDIYDIIQDPDFGQYDLIHAGDVIEHLPKDKALFFLNEIPKHCKNFILSIPIGKEWANYKVDLTNPAEDHLSYWTPEEFTGFYKITGTVASLGQVNTYWWRY